MLEMACSDYNKSKKKIAENNLHKGLVAFGSARIPMDDPHIKEIMEISEKCAKRILEKKKPVSFITGGGPSVMTAWLEPAYKLGAQSSGMALVLPHETAEQQLQYANEEISCVLQTFQSRKALLLEYARCIVIFKGGFGTMDELFEALTFMKTGKIPNLPILVYPADFYKDVLNFSTFLEAKTIRQSELDVIKFMNSKEELLENLYKIIDEAE